MSDPKDLGDLGGLFGALKDADLSMFASQAAYGQAAQQPTPQPWLSGLGLGAPVGTIKPDGQIAINPLGVALPMWALAAAGVASGTILLFGLLGRRSIGMRTQELVALLAGSILSGTEYQVKLRACETPEEMTKVVDEATTVAHAVILSAARSESLQALEKQKREIEDRIDSAKAKLDEVSRGLGDSVQLHQKPAPPAPPTSPTPPV